MLNSNLTKSKDKPFLKSDLEKLNQQNSGDGVQKEASEAGRSLKSEYDYGSKRKFVDVLGNVNKKNTFNLEQAADKNNELASVRSRYSEISRQNKTSYKE